jgi:hypothetical protein
MPTLKILCEGMPDAPDGVYGTRTLWAIDDNTAAEQRKA